MRARTQVNVKRPRKPQCRSRPCGVGGKAVGEPLSYDGGHGKIGYWIEEGSTSAMLPSVPGEAKDLPEGSFVEKRNRATGDYARPGYLPPCSGGRGNKYFAEVKAVQKVEGKKKPEVLAKAKISSASTRRFSAAGTPRRDCRASTTPTHMEGASTIRRAAPAGSCFRDDFLHAGKVTERLSVWGAGADYGLRTSSEHFTARSTPLCFHRTVGDGWAVVVPDVAAPAAARIVGGNNLELQLDQYAEKEEGRNNNGQRKRRPPKSISSLRVGPAMEVGHGSSVLVLVRFRGSACFGLPPFGTGELP